MVGFINKTLDVRTGNGLDDTLMEPLIYSTRHRLLRAPTGSTTDGLSVPRCLQNIIPATGGDWFSGALHDSAYRNQLEKFVNGKWVRAELERWQCDDLILEAMKSQGVGIWMRQVIYRSLQLFGGRAFRNDRKPASAAP